MSKEKYTHSEDGKKFETTVEKRSDGSTEAVTSEVHNNGPFGSRGGSHIVSETHIDKNGNSSTKNK